VIVFVLIAAIFFLYDKYLQKERDVVTSQAKRAEAIVTSVFPKGVGLRLIKQAEREETSRVSDKKMLNNFLVKNGEMGQSSERAKPIADLFPSTTVMFADIVGFTAWSSMREPSQVFVLLESIYKEFDTLAKRRKVFKVETVGDCYVAVCGLPDPRKDHPVVMSRFASDCIRRMAVQVRALEVELVLTPRI
jgi:class 3 adenylate cyclase